MTSVLRRTHFRALGERTPPLEFGGTIPPLTFPQAHASGGEQGPLQPGLIHSHYYKECEAGEQMPLSALPPPLPFPAATHIISVCIFSDVYFHEGIYINMRCGRGEAVFKIKFKSLLR